MCNGRPTCGLVYVAPRWAVEDPNAPWNKQPGWAVALIEYPSLLQWLKRLFRR